MDRESVIRHLRAWVDGVDVTTGAVLGADHPGQQPEILRVAFAALALLQQTPAGAHAPGRSTAASAPTAPRNAGRQWSSEDDDALVQGFDAGEPIGRLAAHLARTRGAINARLVKLGKIEMPPGLRLRGE